MIKIKKQQRTIIFLVSVFLSSVLVGCGGGGEKIQHTASSNSTASSQSSTASNIKGSITLSPDHIQLTAELGRYTDDVTVEASYVGDAVILGYPPEITKAPIWLEQNDWRVLTNEKKVRVRIRANNFVPLGHYQTRLRFVVLNGQQEFVTKDLPIDYDVVPQSASSQSSKASSSSASVDNNYSGNIFINSLDPAWFSIGTYEYDRNINLGKDIYESEKAKYIHWQIVDDDSDHQKVIEVSHEKISNGWNVFEIDVGAANRINLSAFASGKLTFDFKLLDAGLKKPPLVFRVDCGYPCESHRHLLSAPNLNQWYSQEINIADLIQEGLDIEKVRLGFTITPPLDNQQGVKYRVDNIRLQKGKEPLPRSAVPCYKESFDTEWLKYFREQNLPLFYQLEVLQGDPGVVSGALWEQTVSYIPIRPSWRTPEDTIGFAPGIASSVGGCLFLNNHDFTVQTYVPDAYVKAGRMRLGLYYEDWQRRRAYFSSVSVATMLPNAWSNVSAALSTYDPVSKLPFERVEEGFDPNGVLYVGIYFDANGAIPPAISKDTDPLTVDNFMIKAR